MRILILAALAFSAVGCGGSDGPAFPDLAPVSGVVKRGDKAVAGGVLTLTPERADKGEFLINSEVGPDGRFALTTVRTTDRSGERKSGVAAGTYGVTYLPPAGDQTSGGVPAAVTLPPLTVRKEGNTNLTLTLPKK